MSAPTRTSLFARMDAAFSRYVVRGDQSARTEYRALHRQLWRERLLDAYFQRRRNKATRNRPAA